MSEERMLCRLADIPPGEARGFLREGNDDLVFAVRLDRDVLVWLNDCPHNHRPLEFQQDRFLSADGRHIVCSAHSARFDLRSGLCLAGPCEGDSLRRVSSRIADDTVWIEARLPAPPSQSAATRAPTSGAPVRTLTE